MYVNKDTNNVYCKYKYLFIHWLKNITDIKQIFISNDEIYTINTTNTSSYNPKNMPEKFKQITVNKDSMCGIER